MIKRYRITIDLQGAPELPNAIGRKHWRTKHSHSIYWRRCVVGAAWDRRPVEPLERAKVTIEVWRKRRPDPDNLVASIKPILDGLQPGGPYMHGKTQRQRIGCGIIADDREHNFEGGRAEVNFRQCTKGERPHVRITVEEKR